MNFLKLEIDKIAIHQIFPRDGDRREIAPKMGTQLIRFDDAAMSDFKRRIIDSLGSGSAAVRMKIDKQCEKSTATIASKLHILDEDDFIKSSYGIAQNLSSAQTRMGTSGGIVVIFTAFYNPSKLKLVGIIKAEIHSGYEKFEDNVTGLISLKHVEELLLTPSTKLYKSAGFFSRSDSIVSTDLNDQWLVEISDYQISKSDGKAAAQYFYQTFLGCDYPESNARTTKQYFEVTSRFINELDIIEEERINLHNALYADLKTRKSDQVTPLDFAKTYMSSEQTDDYKEYLEESEFPIVPFMKDTQYITSKIKNRRVKFSSDIRLSAPSEVFQELVKIEEIDGETTDSGDAPRWTQILIKDRITNQQ